MASIRKALLFGFLIWFIPFIVAFLVFPLRESWRALFESIMPLAVTIPTALFAVLYFWRIERAYAREGILIGLLWLLICIIIDLPLMLFGPFAMSLAGYMADIGLTYAIIPTITIAMGIALAAKNRHAAASLAPGAQETGGDKDIRDTPDEIG